MKRSEIKTVVLMVLGIAILGFVLYKYVSTSYRECTKYFSGGYCFFHPVDWPKSKGMN